MLQKCVFRMGKFTDFVDILDNKRVPINSGERENRKGEVPYYGATGQVGWIDDFLFDEELVLLGEDGAPFLESNKNKAYLISGKSWVNNHAHVLRGKNGLLNKFLLYWLNIIDYRNFISGTTRYKLNQSRMKDIPIPILPTELQKQIVDEIEKQFTRLEASVKDLKSVKDKLEIYKKSVLKAAFEGKIVNGNFKEKNIGELYNLIDGDRGRNYPKKSDFFEKGDCLFLTTKNVRPNGFKFEEIQFISKEKDKELRAGKLSRGDLVITTRGTLGNVGIYDDSVQYDHIRINSGMLILRDKSNEVKNQYLIKFIQSPFFTLQLKKMQSGTAQPQIPVGTLKYIKINFPGKDIQERIIQEIESHFSVIDKLKEVIDFSLNKTEQLRKSILKSAFEGKLVKSVC